MAKTVLITGGSRGIGAATAREFARHGWSVAVNYCHSAAQATVLTQELVAMGVQALALEGDVSDSAQANQLVVAAKALGSLDALVCCAGIALPQQLLTDTTDAQWRQVMGVDLDGVFYPVRAAVGDFVRRGGGSIVTVSSMWGITGASCEVAYSAAKAGVIGLTRALAKELGPSKVRVNCVAPGVICTQMNENLSEEDLVALREDIPLGELGSARQVAKTIYFLACEDADYITGQVIQVDGGMVI